MAGNRSQKAAERYYAVLNDIKDRFARVSGPDNAGDSAIGLMPYEGCLEDLNKAAAHAKTNGAKDISPVTLDEFYKMLGTTQEAAAKTMQDHHVGVAEKNLNYLKDRAPGDMVSWYLRTIIQDLEEAGFPAGISEGFSRLNTSPDEVFEIARLRIEKFYEHNPAAGREYLGQVFTLKSHKLTV